MAPLTTRAWGALARLPVPVQAWLASRALVLGLAVVFSVTIGEAPRGVDPGVPDLYVRARLIDPAVPAWLVLLGEWDTTWYLDIARHGYAHDAGQVGILDSNLAFFPLIPGIAAAFLAIGVNPFFGVLVLVHLAFLGALWALWALTRRHLASTRLADRATWAFALLPPTVFASMAYTEALVLACALGAALLAVRGHFALAGLPAAVAALSRPPGIIVAALVVLIALTAPADPARRVRRAAIAVLPSAAALAAFGLWMWAARGSPTLPLAAQGAWDRGQLGVGLFTAFPSELAAAADQIIHLDADSRWTSAVRDVAFTALYGWLLARLWRDEGGLRSPWVAYSAAALAIPLSTGSFGSMSRFGILAFPLMWPLARWLDVSPRRRAWAAAAAVLLMALLVAQLRLRAP